MAGFMHA